MRTILTRACGRERALALALCLFAGLPGAAFAQPDAQPAYRQTLTDAVAEFEAKNFVESRALFLRAHKIYPNARTLRSLGAVSFELRSYAECVGYLDAALASSERPLEGDLRQQTERLRERARRYVAEIHLTLDPPSASVLVDGQPVTLRPPSRSLWLDIGEHEVEFQAEGHEPERRKYVVQGADAATWSITLAPSQPVAIAAPAPAPEAAAAAAPALQEPSGGEKDGPGPSLSPRARRRRAWAGGALALAGAASLGASAYTFTRHTDDGRQVRMSAPGALEVQNAWKDSRVAPLALGGLGSALLTSSAAVVAELVPRRHRRWLSPLLLAAGTGALAAGLYGIRHGGGCDADAPGGVRGCVLANERLDRGLIGTLVALPLLTMPVLHTVDWLRGRR